MKIFLFVMIFFGFNAISLAATKTCKGLYEAKGDTFVVTLTDKEASVEQDSQAVQAGTYQFNGYVNGKDGYKYISYDVGSDEGSYVMLVNSNLLKDKTSGLIKFRWTGESYQETKYLCKDLQ
jgi:hypothetical protein